VAQPDGGRLLCTVGDHPTALLYDAASGRQVAELQGHADYSFAAAWHPDGNVLATGNQVRGCGRVAQLLKRKKESQPNM
jgi:WD40 repeat protein